MNKEKQRLAEEKEKKYTWKKWGPYLTERQWGTVREDYSPDGDVWRSTTHDMARSKAYRWGEEGIAGISNNYQNLCFSVALWNGKDPLLKERLFGLNGPEGNHGEDVKEYYYYLDNTPAHSYMKMLYKYPQEEFPYELLKSVNQQRSRLEPEYELIDTGIFEQDRYFDVFVEYAKVSHEDLLIQITVFNRGPEKAVLNIIPQIWFRNTWAWGYDDYKPELKLLDNRTIETNHRDLGIMYLYSLDKGEILFCENETNIERLYNAPNTTAYPKDGINDYIVNGDKQAVNPENKGTKAAINITAEINSGESQVIKLRFTNQKLTHPFNDFEKNFSNRIEEADEFYEELQEPLTDEEKKMVQRQAFAGMLWGKQFYYFDVVQWLNGDPGQPKPSPERIGIRNGEWIYLNNHDIISMPDKWEYPWYAAWDLGFHCIPFASLDPDFAKDQLIMLTREWYMHPNGQLPAYEWNFSDVNPPVHAWATWRVYEIEKKENNGKGDLDFLERVFHKLLINFTWWVNKKDRSGRNVFAGGFLGLDNIGVFDRSHELPTGGYIEQSDGTSWMAMFSLNMLRISLELAKTKAIYQDLSTKFFEHFLYIAFAMTNIGDEGISLWDEDDQFFYDVLHTPKQGNFALKVRSLVGLIPLFAVEVLDYDVILEAPEFEERLEWFLKNRVELGKLVSNWEVPGHGSRRLLSILRGHRMKMLLRRALDETEFLSDYGIRGLSKYYENDPYVLYNDDSEFRVTYQPGESESGLFGGNSNWRGPIWFPVNFLIIESLERFHYYYSDDFKIEYPTNSGKMITLKEVADELTKRLVKIFLKDENGRRPVFGENEKFQTDPHFKDYLLFHEYFHGETGKGLGASHQTGWTGLITRLLYPRKG